MTTVAAIPFSDEEPAVLVVGSGAAGLVAALTAAHAGASVLVIESADRFGGTTALGGGRVWIAANGEPANDGDSVDLALDYLQRIFDPRFPEFSAAFVRDAPAMRAFVEQHSPHRFVNCPNYPDYHQEYPSATTGGRCFDVGPVCLDDLVAESARVLEPPGYLPMTHAEWETWRRPERFDRDLLARRAAARIKTGGTGMIAALLDGCVRAGVRVSAGTELVDLGRDPGGTLSAEVVVDSTRYRVRPRAVILASGGFDADPSLRRRLLPAALGASASAHTNTGIALRIAERWSLPLENTGEGWWMPMIQVAGETLDGEPHPRALIRERGVPHQIVVNSLGERFVDEAAPYNEFGKAIHRPLPDGSTPNSVAWLIFDQAFRSRYPLPGLAPEGPLPDHILSAPDLVGLAERIDLPVERFVATVERWNNLCETGVDIDFGRGGTAYDLYYGDPELPGNRCLGPLDRAPYYAVRVFSAVIGSKGGPITDVDGRLVDGDGATVPGVFAVGNAAAFWTADGYPGPGATLGVAMTSGFRAGRAAAGGLG